MPDIEKLHTNRDLYLFIAGLDQDIHQTGEAGEADERCERQRSLEDYLKMLWHLGNAHRRCEALSLATFAGLLEAALHQAPPPFDPRWSDGYQQGGRSGHARWERTILDQIVDLHEMQDAGTLANELRYFGVNAPRGARWYNFTPLAFLECAFAGTFDGWQAGDPTGRDFVPGPVAVVDEAGQVTSADPQELERPIRPIAEISWDAFTDFLLAGQYYE
jgi:hypothetical protein